MRFRSLFGPSCVAASLVACANGRTLNGATEGGGGSGEGGSPETTSSASETLPPCDETPCKLVAPQCGCLEGDMCVIDGSGERECRATGAFSQGEACEGLYSCTPGMLCVLSSSDVSTCAIFCDDDTQCGGGICILPVVDPADPESVLPGVTLCSEDCDPISNAGCAEGLGLGCHLFQEQVDDKRVFTSCTGAGGGVQNDPCTSDEDCAPGSACFTFADDSSKCLQYCDVKSPGCAVCQELDPPLVYGGVDYGVCL